MPMVEVRLHGELAREFGKIWHLDITSPAEAAHAINCMRPGFSKKIRELDARGMVFRVRSREHDYDNDDVVMQLSDRIRRIDIIPIVRGASAGIRFVVGAILTAVSFLPGMQMLAPVGISMMLGSIVEWLTPVPKSDKQSDSALQSWTFNGPTNTTDQGSPVPIIYGEVLTGAQCISAGVAASQLTPGGAVSPEIRIGGQEALWGSVVGDQDPTGLLHGGKGTIKAVYGVGVFNLAGPLSYQWTWSGFNGADAVVIHNANGSAATLEVRSGFLGYESVYSGNDSLDRVYTGERHYTGTIHLSVTGRETNATSGDTPQMVTLSASMNIKADFYYDHGYTGSE